MKKLFLFLAMASTTMFVSCGSDDSDPTTEPVEEATAITLSASLPAIEVGQSVTFTVTNDLAENVTSTSTFTANNVAFTGPTFTPTEAGSFVVVAKNGDLTSAAVTITVTATEIVASDSFVVDGTEEFVTPMGAFALYGGIQQQEDGTYYGLIAFNPYNEVMDGENPTYPTDLYIWGAYQLTPDGVDPETGEDTFTQESVMADLVGSFTFDPEAAFPTLFDVSVLANDEELVASGSETIASVTLDITSATAEALNGTYTITLTDGTVIEGEYSGAGGIYTIPAAKSAIAAKNVKMGKSAKAAKNIVVKGLKSKR